MTSHRRPPVLRTVFFSFLAFCIVAWYDIDKFAILLMKSVTDALLFQRGQRVNFCFMFPAVKMSRQMVTDTFHLFGKMGATSVKACMAV